MRTKSVVAFRITAIAAAMIASAAIVLASGAVLIAAEPTATQVTLFTPAMPSGAAQDGSCWTTSIAAPRPGAWRCMIGNAIHDPCFQVPPHRGVLVCDANPATGHAGFVLRLTKPLPNEMPPVSANPAPWMLQLADGSVCKPFTGTMPTVGGEPARWYCYNPSAPSGSKSRDRGLVTRVTPGTTWTAERFAQSAAGPRREMGNRRVQVEHERIVRVWE